MLRKSLRKGHIFYTDPKRLLLDTIILPSTLFGWKICYIGKEHLVSVASKDQLGYGILTSLNDPNIPRIFISSMF